MEVRVRDKADVSDMTHQLRILVIHMKYRASCIYLLTMLSDIHISSIPIILLLQHIMVLVSQVEGRLWWQLDDEEVSYPTRS